MSRAERRGRVARSSCHVPHSEAAPSPLTPDQLSCYLRLAVLSKWPSLRRRTTHLALGDAACASVDRSHATISAFSVTEHHLRRCSAPRLSIFPSAFSSPLRVGYKYCQKSELHTIAAKMSRPLVLPSSSTVGAAMLLSVSVALTRFADGRSWLGKMFLLCSSFVMACMAGADGTSTGGGTSNDAQESSRKDIAGERHESSATASHPIAVTRCRVPVQGTCFGDQNFVYSVAS